ncbi:MAG: response regulator [Microcoleaceae cyanobacterium]
MDSTPTELSKASILVIDDTPANLRLLVNLLTQRGYKVRALPSGKLALAGIKESPPDLILLDILMPEMNGYEVCEYLKADTTTQNIPVIFISAIHEVMDKVRAFSVGGIDYITKPFQAEEVLARVETHLEKQSLQSSLQQRNNELAQALAELKTTQDQLIQSEKMAALGQLVASIAHEINTPLGAIRASSSNTKSALQEFFQGLPRLLSRLSPEQQSDFLWLLNHSIGQATPRSTKQQRQLKRQLVSQLENQQVPDARKIAEILADIQINADIEPILPFLRSPDRNWILQAAYNLICLQKNSQNITVAVERAAKTVFALKSYAHYSHSGEKQFAQIVDGLETVLELYRSQLQHGIQVIRNYDTLQPILCYPDELTQVWINLVHNALHAMQDQGKLQLDITEQILEQTCEQTSYQVVSIADSGSGIPPEIQGKIFQPFFTTKPVGEGSGLGLDIVQKIVEKHQGKVEFESVPGNTVFRVFLPVTGDSAV